MNAWTKLAGRSLLAAGIVAGALFIALRAPAQENKLAGATARIVKAANTFLSTLTEDQRRQVVYAYNDDRQRARWSNFPTGFVKRGGIDLGEMTPPQREAAMVVVAAALSRKGYEKVLEIMRADEVLKETGGARDQNMFGKDLYYISMLGTPSEKEPWMLQFGGHHLAINLTLDGAKGVFTPTLTGAQPAMYTENGKTIRPLGDESDKGLAMIQALDGDRQKKAILSYDVSDLVLGPGQDGRTIVPEGLKASEMTESQRTMLMELIKTWVGIQTDEVAQARMSELKKDLNDTWFAWSGPTTAAPGHNIAAYYRIQGPKLVIEYAPQSLGGDLTMHVHTIYRDPTNDYGKGLVSR